MKKIISAFVASVLSVSALSAVSATAVKIPETNKYTISTSNIENDTVVNETIIPAGSVAVTVNINNNYGFSASATKLNIGEFADVVVDEEGCPIVTKGDVLDDCITASAVKDGTIVVSSASDKKTNKDGEMFTIYVAENYSGVSVKDITNESILMETDTEANTNAVAYRYKIGNVDNDQYINAVDATMVLHATSVFKDKNPDKNPNADFTVSLANEYIDEYFPNIRSARVADTNKNGIINKADANNILKFYSYVSTGYTIEEAYNELSVEYDNYCSEIITVVFEDIWKGDFY